MSLSSNKQFFKTKAASQSLSGSWSLPRAEASPSVRAEKHSAVSSMASSLRREEMTGPLPGSGHCAHKEKLCAVAVPPILFGSAVVGSCATGENEDACGRSVSGLRPIVEGAMGKPWSEERSPDEAKLLQERLTFREFYFIDSVPILS